MSNSNVYSYNKDLFYLKAQMYKNNKHYAKQSEHLGHFWIFLTKSEYIDFASTVLRALGIPCRTVTVFDAAHDSDGSVTLDVHWDLVHNVELTELNTDSLWYVR